MDDRLGEALWGAYRALSRLIKAAEKHVNCGLVPDDCGECDGRDGEHGCDAELCQSLFEAESAMGRVDYKQQKIREEAEAKPRDPVKCRACGSEINLRGPGVPFVTICMGCFEKKKEARDDE